MDEMRDPIGSSVGRVVRLVCSEIRADRLEFVAAAYASFMQGNCPLRRSANAVVRVGR